LSFFAPSGLVPAEPEFVIRRKDGTEFPCEAAFSVLEGEDVLAVAALRDISERKRFEAAQAQLEGRLHQSERLESLGLLAGGVAHDFNNLLAVIRNYASYVKSELSDDDPLAGEVAEIEEAARRASEITHRLLVFARRGPPALEPVDLNAVVSRTKRLLERTLGEGVELRTELAADVPPITADPGQLDQVVVNLALNARDAMDDGGVLTLSTAVVEVAESNGWPAPDARAGRYVRLAVSDTGNGVAPEVAARAFEPFFTTKPKGTGTGLGLATVHGTVTQSGGHARLTPRPGGGALAEVLLPVEEAAPAYERPDEPRSDGPGRDSAPPPPSQTGPQRAQA
jgi:two-component system cell cycle sensor histidine kinase/response regulator CckA